MGLIRELTGEIRVRLRSADPGKALSAVNAGGIRILDAAAEDDLTLCFTVSRGDYRKLCRICGRRGDILKPVGRQGVYWDLKGLAKRPLFVVGIVFLMAVALFLPSRIVMIEVDGNQTVADNRILETAENCGIRFGAARQAVRSEKVKNALLEALPELSWAGVNTYGCRAVITVRERREQSLAPEPANVTNIIAARDGYILSCDVVSGNGLCVPGQAVKAGEVLISGYTDCGICITATRAEGEIIAATRRQINAVTPAQCLKKGHESVGKVNYSLIVGKNRINFDNNSGILDASCGRMVTNYHLTLPGGCRLPVTLVKETITDADLSVTAVNGEAALRDFAARYLGTQMIAGKVTAAVETITEDDGVWILAGDYACTEMIGRERSEQNGELHETN